jgi:acetoin utilization protein AcuB
MHPLKRTPETIRSLMNGRSASGARSLPFARHAVARFMTSAPHCIGREQSLTTAHEMMRTYAVRHLPVLEGGRLAGVVSQRDLYFVEALGVTDQDKVTVGEAMSQETFSARPESSVEDVALEMAEHKYGCAVIMDGERVVGVFTTTDALRALAELAHAPDAE